MLYNNIVLRAVNAVAFVVFTINAKAKGICVWHEHYQHLFAASYLLHKFQCNVAVANDDYANDVVAQKYLNHLQLYETKQRREIKNQKVALKAFLLLIVCLNIMKFY